MKLCAPLAFFSVVVLHISVLHISCGDNGVPILGVEEVASACVITAACDVEARPAVSTCIDNYFDTLLRRGEGGLYGAMYRCAIAAQGSCPKVPACFGAGQPCSRKEFSARCDGTTAVECDLIDGRVYARRCGDAGLTCRVDPVQTFAADCVCDASYQARCEGRFALRCERGQVIGTDCRAEGLRCEDGRCTGSKGAPCDALYQPSCDGSTALRCVEGQERRIPCDTGRTRHTCKNGTCVPPGTQCRNDDFNRCTADGALEACIDGSWHRFDCEQLGLAPCEAPQYGANCTEPLGTRY